VNQIFCRITAPVTCLNGHNVYRRFQSLAQGYANSMGMVFGFSV
jgi:hypothetical protein